MADNNIFFTSEIYAPMTPKPQNPSRVDARFLIVLIEREIE
jgi:hypothetical protein